MRKPFVSLIANDQYQIGCTGQTVYLLDTAGSELAKFKDMTYAYYPALHPGIETIPGGWSVYLNKLYSGRIEDSSTKKKKLVS